MSAGPLDRETFLAGYLAEVEEHLALVTRHLLQVETALARGEAQPAAVRELYRSLHTIKGLSAMVDVEPIVEIAHGMETVLRLADRAGGRLSHDTPEVLIA